MPTRGTVAPLVLDRAVARRYLLGWQGLWPGRRWVGRAGAATALQTLGAVQMDPLTVVARSHDLVLWARVADYTPHDLDALLYRERAFFDYGGHLDIHPIAALPYWRPHMRRRAADERQQAFAAEHAALLDEVRAAIRARGPLAGRDFAGARGAERHYRGGKLTSRALYHLWLTGELLTHSRRGFERRYELRERVAPPDVAWAADDEAAEAHFVAAALPERGLLTAREFAGFLGYRLHRRIAVAAGRARLDALVAAGAALPVRVAGVREAYYVPASAAPILDALQADRVPPAWAPCGPTTAEEAVFLSPLDNLLDRARTAALFDFDYLWEIYKPPARRRWGAYTLPILYDDRLVARLDPRLERASATLRINGLWLEDAALADDPAFVAALARGLAAFATFHAATPDLTALDAPLRARLMRAL